MTANRKKSPFQLYSIMAVSFIIASVLTVYPLFSGLAVFRPMWLMMVLIFWLIFQPSLVGVGVAFGVGLASDLLTDSRLGQQALCAVVVGFLIKLIGSYVKQLSLTTVWLLTSAGLLVYQVCLIMLHVMMQGLFAPQLLYSVFLSVLIWPLFVAILAPYTH